jgi:hypothetical protein
MENTQTCSSKPELQVTPEVVKALYEHLEVYMSSEEMSRDEEIDIGKPCSVNKNGRCEAHDSYAHLADDRCLEITAREALAIARGESLSVQLGVVQGTTHIPEEASMADSRRTSELSKEELRAGYERGREELLKTPFHLRYASCKHIMDAVCVHLDLVGHALPKEQIVKDLIAGGLRLDLLIGTTIEEELA